MNELDVFQCELDGVSQIEASAGTGKTWNLCALYVRLLLEKKLNVEQILVVTFTKAAAAELQERIRGRLVQLLRVIETRLANHANGDNTDSADVASTDPFIAGLFNTTLATHSHSDLDATAKQLRVALRWFDQAAIHTIHAFCQRALLEAPFAAAMPFSFETQTDDASLRFELAADFWREKVEPFAACHPGFAAWLVENRVEPAMLETQLAQRLKKPLAALCWSGIDPNVDVDGDASSKVSDANRHIQNQLDEAYAKAHALWQTERDNIVAQLDAALASASLDGRSYKQEIIDKALFAWDDWFAQDDQYAPLPDDTLKLTASNLKKKTKKGKETPAHDFFLHADELAKIDALQYGRWLALLREWLTHYAPDELAKRKRVRRVMSFDDLLTNLHQALTRNPELVNTLRARYPAALIDEFQDTDPLQFDIFKCLFAPQGPLFLIGDPKQAIYSFRAADLHTYLAARKAASARYTLAVNQRSTPAMIQACNRLFSMNPHAFVLDNLDYQPVHASDRPRNLFVDEATNATKANPDINADANGNDTTGDFIVWTLPGVDNADDNKGGVLKKADARHLASVACAAEIVRLLRGAQEGRVKIGAAPLKPDQIAVLVQTHKQGSLIKHTLAEWGVGSVELAKKSVFESPDAEQIERVLAAIDTPGDLRRLRAALATDWFGLNAQALWQSVQSGADSASAVTSTPDAMQESRWVERFSHYRILWRERGFAVMWRTLADELGIAQWLVAQPDGERRLTDVNHLAELLQARAAAQPGIAPTLRWLSAQRCAEDDREETQLRLESDRNLVQIVTIHKSKGLEYAVVFCPFINDDSSRKASSSRFDAREYHIVDVDDSHTVLHYGLNAKNDKDAPEYERLQDAVRQVEREQAAERVRLLYVALTRAVHRCYVVAEPHLTAGMLNWLVAGGKYSFDEWIKWLKAKKQPQDKQPSHAEQIAACWSEFAKGPVSMTALPLDPPYERLASSDDTQGVFHARAAHRPLHTTWRLASFSALVAAGARREQETLDNAVTVDVAPLIHEDARPDHDATVEFTSNEVIPNDWVISTAPTTAASVPASDDILNFPRGAAAGECLHRMFELANFADSATWPAASVRALHERPVTAGAEFAPQLPAMMQRLLADVTTTELAPAAAPGMTLASLDPMRRLNEFEFVFPASSLDFDALRHVLREHDYPDVMLEPGTLNGFMKGFIDMVFEHAGRYWIIDWKSNHLGDTPTDYDALSLDHAMTTHAYHLQALLYTVALHRYLRVRLPDYDYDAHGGGYLYLFVRGVRAAWQATGSAAGIHARRPARALIETLDRLMDGETA